MQIEDRELRVTESNFERERGRERENKEGGLNDVYRIARVMHWENKEML